MEVYWDPSVLDRTPGNFTFRPFIDPEHYAQTNVDGSRPQAKVVVSAETARLALSVMQELNEDTAYVPNALMEIELNELGIEIEGVTEEVLAEVGAKVYEPFKTFTFNATLEFDVPPAVEGGESSVEEVSVNFAITAPSLISAAYAFLEVSDPVILSRVIGSLMPAVEDDEEYHEDYYDTEDDDTDPEHLNDEGLDHEAPRQD